MSRPFSDLMDEIDGLLRDAMDSASAEVLLNRLRDLANRQEAYVLCVRAVNYALKRGSPRMVLAFADDGKRVWPDDPFFWEGAADAHAMLDERDAEVECCLRAVALTPHEEEENLFAANTRLAEAALSAGRYEICERVFQDAPAVDRTWPELPFVSRQLVIMRWQVTVGRVDEARETCARILELIPRLQGPHAQLFAWRLTMNLWIELLANVSARAR